MKCGDHNRHWGKEHPLGARWTGQTSWGFSSPSSLGDPFAFGSHLRIFSKAHIPMCLYLVYSQLLLGPPMNWRTPFPCGCTHRFAATAKIM